MEMPPALARGFKIQRDDLRTFLVENGTLTIEDPGEEPFSLLNYDGGIGEVEEEGIIAVLRQKGIDCNLRIVMQERDPDRSTWVYICFTWIYLISNENTDMMDKPVPTSFENLRQMLRVQSPICQFILYPITEPPRVSNLFLGRLLCLVQKKKRRKKHTS